MLAVCAKAYRAPSVNWFVTEMIACMLNPSRWQEFSLRLANGQQQLTMELGQSAILQDTPRREDPFAGTRKRGERRGRAAAKRRAHG